MDPVDIIHHSGVNAGFPPTATALPPADDPVQEADVPRRTSQRTPRVALRKHIQLTHTNIEEHKQLSHTLTTICTTKLQSFQPRLNHSLPGMTHTGFFFSFCESKCDKSDYFKCDQALFTYVALNQVHLIV